jgi:hypothetical protein
MTIIRLSVVVLVLTIPAGCSLSAAWSSPSQQQVTSPTAPVTQDVQTESPQHAGPASGPASLPKLLP